MKKVGVLGGMGPQATIDFLDMIVENTPATKDQDHLNMIVSVHSTIPDRSAYLLGKSVNSPVPYLIEDAQMLERAGCDFLVCTCNTSYFAYDDIVQKISIPFLNMPLEVAKKINDNPKIKTVGLMVTSGALKAGVYEKYLHKEVYYANKELNNEVMSLIYDKVKKGIKVSKDEFYRVANKFFDQGCDAVILGCTELSVIAHDNALYNDDRLVDAMKILTDRTIEIAKND